MNSSLKQEEILANSVVTGKTVTTSTVSDRLVVTIDSTKLTFEGGNKKLNLDGDLKQGEASGDAYFSYQTVTGGTKRYVPVSKFVQQSPNVFVAVLDPTCRSTPELSRYHRHYRQGHRQARPKQRPPHHCFLVFGGVGFQPLQVGGHGESG